MCIDERHIETLDTLWHRMLHEIFAGKSLPSQDERLRDVTTLDLTIISSVARKPDIILKEIREATNLPNSTLTSVIDRLERRGWLKRIISERDRRSYGLVLTEQGQEVYQAHFDYERFLFTTMLGMLDSDEERETFLRLFGKILTGVQQYATISQKQQTEILGGQNSF